MNRSHRLARWSHWLLLGALCGAPVLAQTWPAKPVRIIVPFSPGGSTDVTARVIGQRLGELVGQSFVIDNRAGAGGNIGADLVAKAPADGYTLLLATTGVMSINQYLYKSLPFDPERDFIPITQLGGLPLVLVANPSLPARSLKELVQAAKRRPGDLTFASSGIGGSTHMTAELFNAASGLKMVHVPYKGSPQAILDLTAGNVILMFDQVVSSMPQVNAGKLRALAITSAKRFPTLPDLPTVAESGFPGFESVSFNGLAAPAGTSRETVNRVQAEAAKALKMPDLRERMLRDGMEPVGSTPEAFAEFIRNERVKWSKVVRELGLRVE
ncbi:MAG: tripartite tricarboxylate transporter substrate binding protein [Proteobacteria bacterium]|nr:tripartite tricarboxylate transporter substrate binding protein [Burkholderiales bacterium]